MIWLTNTKYLCHYWPRFHIVIDYIVFNPCKPLVSIVTVGKHITPIWCPTADIIIDYVIHVNLLFL